MSQLGAVIDCTKRETIASLTSKNIFAMRKPSEEELALKTNEITIFVKIYTRSAVGPLIYCEGLIVQRDVCIGDYVNGVTEMLQLPNGEPWDIFVEEPGSPTPIRSLRRFLSWDDNYCHNGTIIVLQSSRELSRVAEIYALAPPVDNEPTDWRDALPVVSYFTLMVSDTPRTFAEYFSLRADTVDIRMCTYETLQPVNILRVPRRRSLEELSQFVMLASGEKLVENPRTHELLLFANRDKTHVPQTDPISSTLPININFESLFFLVAEKGGPKWRKTLVVEWSDDSYHSTSERAFFVDMPNDFPKVKQAMAGVIGTRKRTRILVIQQFAILCVCPDWGTSLSGDMHLRFEGVPDDQIGTRDTELVKVAQVEVDRQGWYKPMGFPFFLKIAPSFTFEELRDQIKNVRKESDEMMTHFRFAVRQSQGTLTERFDPNKQLKKDGRCQLNFARDSLLMICPADGGLSVSRRSEPFKINN
jgi:hypothetical protein